MRDTLKEINPDRAVLAIDIESTRTRALLFEIVEGRYQFVRAGTAITASPMPQRNVNEGVLQALLDLQARTERRLLDENSRLILPLDNDGNGVDKLVATYTAAEKLTVGLIGLLENLDIANAQRLVHSSQAKTVQIISLADDRPLQEQVDTMLHHKPDVLLLTGGYDDGALQSVARHVELVLLLNRLLPEYDRAQVIYAGNNRLAQRVVEVLQKWTRTKVAPNLNPAPGARNLMPASLLLTDLAHEFNLRQVGGLKQLNRAVSEHVSPSIRNFGVMIRYLSKIYDPVKGVAGLLLGQEETLAAMAVEGDLITRQFDAGMAKIFANDPLDEKALASLQGWLPVEVGEDDVSDTIHQRALYPASLALDETAYAIGQSGLRLHLERVWQAVNAEYDDTFYNCDPIFISGMDWGESSDLYTNLLTALNGIQPIGLTQFIFDQHSLLPALGAIAGINTQLPVQVLGSNAMLSTGPIIALNCHGQNNSTAVKVRVEYLNGEFKTLQGKAGSLQKLPIQPGEPVRIKLQTLGENWLDVHRKTREADIKVTGGVFGGLLDLRPRPITLPAEKSERLLQFMRWRRELELEVGQDSMKEGEK